MTRRAGLEHTSSSAPQLNLLGRIVLVRHGQTAHVDDYRWLSQRQVREYEHAHDAVGILEDDPPPAHLVETAASAHLIACSNLPRAIESAKRLAPDREPHIEPSLTEIQLETPAWLAVRLPARVWDALTFTRWTWRLRLGLHHPLIERADRAADFLAQRAKGNSTVIAVTHGGFRRILTRQLQNRGWALVSRGSGYANWSAWTLASPHAERGRL